MAAKACSLAACEIRSCFKAPKVALYGVINRFKMLRNATEITSLSGLPYRPSSALRQQLHSPAMRLLSRLEDERSCGASGSTYFVRIPYLGRIPNIP